jgi:hypothetical protein
MKSRFDELLPFYVNGSLPPADREWVDAYLREHPRAVGELDWYRTLQTRLRDEAPAVPAEIGLDRALKRIHAERAHGARAASAAPSALARVLDWLRAAVPQPMLRPALAGAAAVVALQAVTIVHLATQNDDELTQLRAVQPQSVGESGPYLKVNFKPDARESDIRMLLIESGGSLAAGPGQLGDYYVRVPSSRVAALANSLKSNAIVDGVAVVDALPGRP